jgi:hypothetical protein
MRAVARNEFGLLEAVPRIEAANETAGRLRAVYWLMLGGFAFPTVAFCRPSSRRAVGYGDPTWRCLQKLGHGHVVVSCLIRCTIPAPTPHSRAVCGCPCQPRGMRGSHPRPLRWSEPGRSAYRSSCRFCALLLSRDECAPAGSPVRTPRTRPASGTARGRPRRRVDRLLLEVKIAAHCVQLGEKPDQVLQRAPESVDRPCCHDIDLARNRCLKQRVIAGRLSRPLAPLMPLSTNSPMMRQPRRSIASIKTWRWFSCVLVSRHPKIEPNTLAIHGVPLQKRFHSETLRWGERRRLSEAILWFL